MPRKLIVNVAAYILAFVFIAVGLNKIMAHQDFVAVLGESPLIDNYVRLIAYPIPILEVIIGVLLLIPSKRKYGFGATIVLLIIFTIYIIYLLNFAPHVPCGCAGIFRKMSWTTHFYVNIGLIILAVLGFWKSRYKSQNYEQVPSWFGVLLTFKKRRSIGNQ